LIAVLGIGGVGKTTLVAKLARELIENPLNSIMRRNVQLNSPQNWGARGGTQHTFQYIIWRSLRNALPLETLLSDLILFLSNQTDTQANEGRLLHWLRTHRCLVILDNFETVLQPGDRAGNYREGYENYGDLLRTVGETAHQSCLIFTSREKPVEMVCIEGEGLPGRSTVLGGSEEVGQALLQAKGLVGTATQYQQLCDRYSGNPLALKIVSTSIQDLFEGDIEPFIAQDTFLFNGIRRLLEEQFERLSYLEQSIMYWLAINREWTSIAELEEDIIPTVSRVSLLEALESLSWRSLIEKRPGIYTQQPVVMEYVSDRLIEKVAAELLTGNTIFLDRFALVKTTVKDYIRESQTRLILGAIAELFSHSFRTLETQRHRVLRLLADLRLSEVKLSGYGAGNLINLCSYLDLDLAGFDFSRLTVRQAYCQKVNLQNVNFRHSNFFNTAFTQSFGDIFTVAFSPDGLLLAAGEMNGQIHVWNLENNQPTLTLQGHVGRVRSVQFSSKSLILASGGNDHTIKLWDIQTGKLLRTLLGHTSGVWSVVFDCSGNRLVSSSNDHTIKLWDVSTGQLLRTFEGHTGGVWSVRFSSDSHLLVSGSDDSTTKLWNTQTGQLLKTMMGHTNRVWSVCFSPDDRLLASASGDSTIKLWDVQTGKLLQTLQGHTSWVLSVHFDSTGNFLVSSSSDHTVKIWEICRFSQDSQPLANQDVFDSDIKYDVQLLRTLRSHTDWVWSVKFSPAAALIVSGGSDHAIKLWNVHSGQLVKTIQGQIDWIQSVEFSPDGRHLVTSSNDGTVRLWDIHLMINQTTLSTPQPLSPTGLGTQSSKHFFKVLTGHDTWVQSARFSPNGKLLVSSSDDCTIRIWDVDDGKPLKVLKEYQSHYKAVSFHPNGQLLASGSLDGVVRVWDVETGQLLKNLKGHSGGVWSVDFSSDGRILGSSSDDHTIKLWDVQTGQLLQTLQGHTNWVWSICFSPTNHLLASASSDHTLKLWDVCAGTLLGTVGEHENYVTSVRFSADGRFLGSASADHTIKVWDIIPANLWNSEGASIGSDAGSKNTPDLHQIGQSVKTLVGHTNIVSSIGFSPDSRYLVSGGADGTVRLWDIQTGRYLQILRGDRPYEGMNITRVTGLTPAQQASLKMLGAIESKD
jgi:WD40 repeat protein